MVDNGRGNSGGYGGGRGGRNPGPLPPKPFAMIPLVEGKKLASASSVGHERLHPDFFYGHLLVSLNVITPLHVGSGLYELVDGKPVRAQLLRQVGEELQAFVPGTSLKGAVRAAVEAISSSCVRVGKREVLQNLSRPLESCAEAKSKSREAAKLCVACAIFGGQGFEGRLSFGDALGAKGKAPALRLFYLPAPYPPQKSGKVYSQMGRFTGRKFYKDGKWPTGATGDGYLAILPNEVLTFKLHLNGLSRTELALVLTAMGCLDSDFDMKLGGGKQMHLGTVDLKVKQASLTGGLEGAAFGDYFSSWDAGPRVLEGKALAAWLGELKKERLQPTGLVHSDRLEHLRHIWKEYDTEAIDGAY